jgi:nitronate monooxygenase
VYKNKTADLVREKEKEKPGDFSVIREYVSGAKYKESFYVTGDTESSVWSCGQVMGLINDIPSCQELIERMVQEAYTIISSKLPQHLSKL